MVGSGVAAGREPEIGYATQGDDDQAGRRPLDRQLRVADQTGQYAADDRGEDAGYRWVAARQGNAQAQRQSNQEDEKSRQEVKADK
jgi:hypothetical protein